MLQISVLLLGTVVDANIAQQYRQRNHQKHPGRLVAPFHEAARVCVGTSDNNARERCFKSGGNYSLSQKALYHAESLVSIFPQSLAPLQLSRGPRLELHRQVSYQQPYRPELC